MSSVFSLRGSIVHNKIFITATDTDAGKTYITSGLLRAAKLRGLTTTAIKPVSSGCALMNEKLYNHDALVLQQEATLQFDYDIVNPFAFFSPIAPHIAAHQLNVEMNAVTIQQRTKPAFEAPADVHFIEGFGGWHAPLNDRETMADFVKLINANVVIVVGMRLGCINHAILTANAVQTSGLQCIGWIANIIDPAMTHIEMNVETLKSWLQPPLLGVVRHGEDAAKILRDVRIF
jgi:dethiobiotin synthetase